MVAFLDPSMGYRCSIAYSDTVSEPIARGELGRLALALGYARVEDLQPTGPEGALEPFTFRVEPTGGSQIAFRLSELAFSRERGTFKLEPFIDVYRAYRRLDLQFDVADLAGVRFTYRGLADYDDARVRVHHHGSDRSHSFQVDVLDPHFKSLGLPEFGSPSQPVQVDQESGGERSPSPRGEWLKIMAAALGAGGLTFLVLSLTVGRPRRPKPQNPA